MPKRTLGEAQRALDEMLLAPSDRRDKEAELERVRSRFRDRLDADLDQRHDRLSEQIEKLEAGLIDVARDLYILRKEGDNLTAREYRARYDKAVARKAELLRRADEIAGSVKKFRQEERHPETAIDEMLTNYPILKPTFSF